MRFWASWYSNNEHWPPVPPLPDTDDKSPVWVSGYSGDDEVIFCAVIEAEDEDVAWQWVMANDFSFVKERFMEERESRWLPNDRFPLS